MNKKKILGVLTCLAAMSVAPAVTQAAADPFAAVPFESGLYEDVAALVHNGLIYGYTDSSFDTKHQLSRYEMAIFTGKALSAYKKATPADQARIKKLAAQFKDELVNMGATNIPGVSTRKGSSNGGGSNGGGKNVARGLGNVTISGKVEHLWNVEKKRYGRYHGGTKYASYRYKNDNSDKNFDIEVMPTVTANLGGGWKGEISFFGAKNRGGIARANENVGGHFDVTRANFSGPVSKRAWMEVGRDKSSTFKSIVMGEYWTGILWKQKINKKLTLNFTWGKPDYNKPDTLDTVNVPYRRYYQVKSYDSGTTKTTYFTTDGNALTSSNSLDTSKATLSYQTISATNGYQPLISNSDGTITTSVSRGTDGGGSYSSYYVLKYSPDDPTTYKFKDSRSVADTHINPANVGITFQSIEANYKFSNKWFMNLGYWLTHSDKVLPANNSFYQVSGVYQRTRLGEIQLGVQPTHKWRLTANLAKSDRNKPVMQSGYEDYQTGKQNTAWMFGAQYGRYSKDVPHTWATVLNIGRCGNQSYIKSGYDMKNDSYGGKGLEWYYLYVPRKNVVASFRYMLIEPLEARIHNGGREDYRQEEFRGEIDWFF